MCCCLASWRALVPYFWKVRSGVERRRLVNSWRRAFRCYAEACGGRVSHYLDANGLECDAVVHLRNGTFGLVEIKLGGDELIEKGAATLNSLASIVDDQKMKGPAFRMVLTAVGAYAYTRKDGVVVCPISALKP